MKKLTQNLKHGKMQILEVPFPTLNKGQVLVKNYYSIISAGTEGRTVKDARSSYIGKAKSRKKELKQVIESIKANGPLKTYNIVMNKLEAPSPLGYSCAGEVIALGKGVDDLKISDLVACSGLSANHAEVVSVYRNLCVKVPNNIDLRHAAFTTIASIAIQGIRQADLRFGESCVVIGLGLVGLLTIQILNAGGIESIGIDIKEGQVDLARQNGADLALNRNQNNIEKIINDFIGEYGADAAIITASSNSSDPVNLAGSLCRKKGKVIIVGRVPTGFERENYYNKELDLRMSTSYGPGRYDANYEEKGIDYPIGYVRWTENRNMKSYIDLLKHDKLNIDNLITHTFDLEKAHKAYGMILEKSDRFGGILIRYDTDKDLKKSVYLKTKEYESSDVNIGLIGAGSFAQNTLLPKMKGICNMIGIVTASGNNARHIAEKYKLNYCTNEVNDLFNDDNINTIFILTRHNQHAQLVQKALEHQKNVFVEKPLAMNMIELEKVKKVYDKVSSGTRLMVGYNRRFSPFVRTVKEMFLDEQPKAINFRVNSGTLPSSHWIHDSEIGGGRIIGEVCHFIDLAIYIAGGKITQVYGNTMSSSKDLKDTVVINLSFDNGSIASISYFSNGNKKLPKEYLEIFCDGQAIIIDNFKTIKIYDKHLSKSKLSSQDKGHKYELIKFFESIRKGLPSPIPFEDLYLSTLATFKVLDSIKLNRVIQI